MTKREKGADRRARLEAEQKAQRAQQRKRNAITAGIGLVVGVLIIGGTAVFLVNQEKDKPANKDLSSFGVSAAAANCGEVLTNKSPASGEHVGPGTNKTDVTKVTYAQVPPTGGAHFVSPLPNSRNFYAVADAPRVENLVHNLEHGYNVVWYSPTLSQSDVNTLQQLSEKIAGSLSDHKFIVAPWNDSYGEFPAGKVVAISHWGAKTGYRQLCGAVSGEAIGAFVDAHPSKDSPEPNAA